MNSSIFVMHFDYSATTSDTLVILFIICKGHDTTTSGISWILYLLASNPQHQKLCQEEIDVTLDGRDSDEILW